MDFKKRFQTSRTLAEKKEILAQYDAIAPLSNKKASKVLGIKASTLNRILNQRQEIEATSPHRGHKFRMTPGHFPQVEMAVTKWLNVGKERGLAFKNMEIQEKAGEFAKAFGIDNEFKFSEGWMRNFLDRMDFDYREFRRENRVWDPLTNRVNIIEKEVEENIIEEAREEFEYREFEKKAKSLVKTEKFQKVKKIKKEKKPRYNFDTNNNSKEFEITFNEGEELFPPEISKKEELDDEERLPSDAETLDAWKVVKRALKGRGVDNVNFFKEGDETVNNALTKHQDEMAWNRIKSNLLQKGYDDLELLKKFEESFRKY